jgi:hypothetical protein
MAKKAAKLRGHKQEQVQFLILVEMYWTVLLDLLYYVWVSETFFWILLK